jgi:hypothetical protein
MAEMTENDGMEKLINYQMLVLVCLSKETDKARAASTGLEMTTQTRFSSPSGIEW